MLMKFTTSYLIIAVLTVVSFVSYFVGDIPITMMAKSIEFGTFFHFCDRITDWGKADPWIAASFAAWIVLYKINRKYSKIALSFFIAFLLSGLLSDVLKFFFGRNRPVMIIDFDTYGFEFFHTKYYKTSFPSGHTATVATLTAMTSYHFKKVAPLAVSFAILIGITRIVTLNHFLSDVLMGFVVGIAASMLVYKRMFMKDVKIS